MGIKNSPNFCLALLKGCPEILEIFCIVLCSFVLPFCSNKNKWLSSTFWLQGPFSKRQKKHRLSVIWPLNKSCQSVEKKFSSDSHLSPFNLHSGYDGLQHVFAQLLGTPAITVRHVCEGGRTQGPLQASCLHWHSVPLHLIRQRPEHAGLQPFPQ